MARTEWRDGLGSDASHHPRRLCLRHQQRSRFRKLYAREEVHAGLLIIVPQVAPDKQRELFDALLEELGAGAAIVNEVIEIALEDGAAVITRYELPGGEANEAEGLS